MNNDILFEISKYINKTTSVLQIDDAWNSLETKAQHRANTSLYLEQKLKNRPTLIELESRNIIKRETLNFNFIHDSLSKIDFKKENSNSSSVICNIAKKLEFFIKKKAISEKLGLNQN